MTVEEEEEEMTTTTYSKEEQSVVDYLSIRGLNTRFMLDGTDFDIFIIKETLDNALDSIEGNAKDFVNGQKPYVKVFVTEEEDGKVTKIRVRNSYHVIDDRVKIFTRDQIKNIFDLTQYYSSKRHRHQINRGELGDAFKAILCIPYAIAVDYENDKESGNYYHWNYPLEIINSKDHKSFKIRIDNINKLRRKEPIVPVIEDIDLIQEGEEEDNTNNQQDHHYIEIVVYLPNTEKAVNYSRIHYFLNRYVLSNTHIDFEFEIPKKVVVNEQLKKVGSYHFNYKATQELKKDWKNKLSIYSYSISDWRGLILSIDKSKDKVNVYDDFIHPHFREGWTLNRDEFFESLTLEELKKDDEKMEIAYHKLRNNPKVNPINEKSSSQKHLELPFEMNKKIREQALKERLKQVYKIDEDSFIYKKIDRWNYESNGISTNNNGDDYTRDNKRIVFPYTLEIVLAKTSNLNKGKRLAVIESLNCSPTLHSYSLFNANDPIFYFEKRNGEYSTVYKIIDILEECKYCHYDEKQHKKDHNLIVLNLISPRIDYRSHSKSHIELKPFAPIGQDIYNIVKSPRSTNNKNSDEDPNNTFHLRILLKERLKAVLKNPDLKRTDRWTQSTIYYILRKRLIDKKIPVKSRKHITGKIKSECEKLGFKRHELGIIASERAQLYFESQALGIGFDQLEVFMKKGTDLLVIEKEGIADVLADFADQKGIAILNSRGFLTEYATELSELAEQNDCNIAILTDLDSSGLLISSNLPNAHRIGIDFKTLERFGLDKKDVQEKAKYKGKGNDSHLPTLKELPSSKIPLPYDKNEWQELIDFLDTGMRIEIDSVGAQVNNNEEFWKFVIEELDIIFPTRNYNRSIKVPDHVLPSTFEQFKENVISIVSEIQAPERSKKIKELKKVEGFLDVKPKAAEIENELRSIVETEEVKNKISEEFRKTFG